MANKDITVRENLQDSDRERYAEIGVNSGVYAKGIASYVPALATGTQISGIVTVTTAGAAEQGDDIASDNGFWIKAHPDNTDTVWVGNDGSNDVSSSNGFPLDPGEAIPLSVANLNHLIFDADVSGEKVCWIKA